MGSLVVLAAPSGAGIGVAVALLVLAGLLRLWFATPGRSPLPFLAVARPPRPAPLPPSERHPCTPLPAP